MPPKDWSESPDDATSAFAEWINQWLGGLEQLRWTRIEKPIQTHRTKGASSSEPVAFPWPHLIAHCKSVHDSISRDLLLKIPDDTEEHVGFLETQLELIEKVGLPNCLQSQMGDLS